MVTDEFDPIVLTDLLGHIYEAASDDRHWVDMAGVLERFYPGARITLFGYDRTDPARGLTVSRNYRSDDMQAYFDTYASTHPYWTRLHRIPIGQACRSEMVITVDELYKTAHYNEYVRPRGLGYHATGICLEHNGDRSVALSLADHHDDTERRARQFRLMEILAPHLTRALRLRRALASMRVEAGAAQAAFNHWAHAALILNSQGGVMSVNSAAEVLLRGADGLSLGRSGKLRCADEATTRMLETTIGKCAAIAAAVDPDARAPEIDGLMLPRPSGATSLRAMMWPLPFLGGGEVREFGPGSVLLVLFDRDHVQRTSVGWMARQFDLTPGEQRLAEAFVNGMTLAEAAEHLGIRLSTARTRLKTIQAKTDCRRQVDLVRLALSFPSVSAERLSVPGAAR